MKKIIETLKDLNNKKFECLAEASKYCQSQINLCRDEFLGSCFCWLPDGDVPIEGLDYGYYACFTDVIEDKEDPLGYYLSAIVVCGVFPEGSTYPEVKITTRNFKSLDDLLYILNEAEKITPAVFYDASHRVYGYFENWAKRQIGVGRFKEVVIRN